MNVLDRQLYILHLDTTILRFWRCNWIVVRVGNERDRNRHHQSGYQTREIKTTKRKKGAQDAWTLKTRGDEIPHHDIAILLG